MIWNAILEHQLNIAGMCGLQIKDRIPKEDTMDDWKMNIDGMNLSGKSERGEYASDY